MLRIRKNNKMSHFTGIPTWVGQANPTVEWGQENKYLFEEHGTTEGFVNSIVGAGNFGDTFLEGLGVPAWLEESFSEVPSTNNTPIHTDTDNATLKKNKFSSPRVNLSSLRKEHNYAITPDNEEATFPGEGKANNNDILPIIDDLLGNSEMYNLEEFMEESPLSSPSNLSAYDQEMSFQNLDEFLHHSTPPAAVRDQSATSMMFASAMKTENIGNSSSFDAVGSNSINTSPLTSASYEPHVSDNLSDSGIGSPSSDVSVTPPKFSYLSMLDDREGASSSATSLPLLDGSQSGLQPGTNQSILVQLLLGNLAAAQQSSSVVQKQQQPKQQPKQQQQSSHLRQRPTGLSQLPAATLVQNHHLSSEPIAPCDDEELNRILDGGFIRPRSASDSSTSSSVSTANSSSSFDQVALPNTTCNDGALNNIDVAALLRSYNQEAVVPSMSSGCHKNVPEKSVASNKSAAKKTQKRFQPYAANFSSAIVKSDDTDSDSSTTMPGTGRKVYKTKEAKIRKMSQNRTAANRYRQKKKTELQVMEQEADELEETNTQLKTKVEDMGREIEYLKNLMLDVIKAKLSTQHQKADQLRSEETLNMLDQLVAM